MVDCLGYLAVFLNVIGVYFIANKRLKGWYCHLAACSLWFAYGLLLPALPMILNACIFALLNSFGIYRWTRG